MEQMSPYMILDEDWELNEDSEPDEDSELDEDSDSEFIRELAALGRQMRLAKITSSIYSTTRPHERLGNAFHGGILFDPSSASGFLWSSDVQSSTPSNMRLLLETELNQIRDMTHTPVRGIDKEIDMISLDRRPTRSLPSCRSVVTPISALPPELLIRIFHFYALEVPPWFGEVQKLGWIGVTHVCRCWRRVALGDSLLWARITGILPNAKWISEMLVRARNAPLVVDFVVPPVPGILSKFAPHIFRIRELRLRGLSVHRPQGLMEICTLEAPALEHFELGVSVPYPVTFRRLGGRTLFRGRAPKLRTLSLSNVSIPRSSIPCGQLTQLKIILFRGISIHSTPSSGDSSQLLDLLINTPDLEVLVLEFRSPTILFQAPDGQAIHLPRLSRLCLGGSTSCVANLLKVLQLPSSTTLHLRCISEKPFTHHVNIILPLVSAHFHNPAPLEFRSLRIAINSLNGLIDVAASTAHPKSTTSVLHALEGDIDSDAELTISFDGLPSFDHPTQEEILEDVFSMLPVSNIEFLSISAPAVVPSVKWDELSQWQRCLKVTTIRASGRGTSGLLRSLAPRIPKKTTPSSKWRCVNRATRARGGIKTTVAHARNTPFPKLTSMLLENLDFGYAMSRHGVLYDFFKLVLAERRRTKMPLSVLGVYHCVITPDRAKGLKKYVQKLRWDGDEGLSAFEERDGDPNFTELDVDFPPGTAQGDQGWFGKLPI